jgi:hypothetical protein
MPIFVIIDFANPALKFTNALTFSFETHVTSTDVIDEINFLA